MSGRMSLGRFEGDAAAYNPQVTRRLAGLPGTA